MACTIQCHCLYYVRSIKRLKHSRIREITTYPASSSSWLPLPNVSMDINSIYLTTQCNATSFPWNMLLMISPFVQARMRSQPHITPISLMWWMVHGDVPSLEGYAHKSNGCCFKDGPLSFNVHLPRCTMEYLIMAHEGGWRIIKHAHFTKRCGLSWFLRASKGMVYVLSMDKIWSSRYCPHVVHFYLNHMGGHGLFVKELSIPEKAATNLSAEQINAGYDFIEEYGPLGSANNQNLRWSDLQRSDPSSPLYGWPQGKIKEALHNLTAGKALAQLIDSYPITLHDIDNSILLNIIAPAIHTATDKGLLLAGVTGIGARGLNIQFHLRIRMSCYIGQYQ